MNETISFLLSKVRNKLIDSGELVKHPLGFIHRPEPKTLGKDHKLMNEYSRHLQKCQDGWCPICDTKIGHAPKCIIGMTLNRRLL